MLFLYLGHVGKFLGHGITRGRFVWHQNRKAFDACVNRSVDFCLSIQYCLRMLTVILLTQILSISTNPKLKKIQIIKIVFVRI